MRSKRRTLITNVLVSALAGFAAQPPPSCAVVPKLRGRQKQSAAKNLLDDFLWRSDQVLADLVDLSAIDEQSS